MILYDFQKILKYANKKIANVYEIFDFIVTKKIPKNSGDFIGKKYQGIDFSGKSFLVRPEELMKNASKYSKKEVVEYIALAARRPLGVYLSSLDTTLDIDIAPVNIPNNRLLYIEDGKIHFLYETTKRK